MKEPAAMNETMFPEISVSGSEKQETQGIFFIFNTL